MTAARAATIHECCLKHNDSARFLFGEIGSYTSIEPAWQNIIEWNRCGPAFHSNSLGEWRTTAEADERAQKAILS